MIQNMSDKDYVAATVNAWNACPSIVKKQLDQQFSEIAELKSQVREGELKLAIKQNDFHKIQSAQMKKDMLKHKEKIE